MAGLYSDIENTLVPGLFPTNFDISIISCKERPPAGLGSLTPIAKSALKADKSN